MRVMVIIKATPSSEAGIMPDEKLLTEMGAFNEALMNAGILIAGDGLHPTSKGVRIQFDGTERTVIDGPFAETKELIAGYWIWEVASMEEAIAWMKRCPNPMPEPSIVEIRRVFEAADFGEAFSAELQLQEEQIRQKLEERNGP